MSLPPVGSPYVHERQVEYWASRGIEDFFWDLGYQCRSYPVSPHVEKLIPADFIFHPGTAVKVFGLQYKALYHGAPLDYWPLSSAQHLQMQQFSWIYYALSELTDPRDLRIGLHALRFPIPSPVTAGAYSVSMPDRYMRWWAFYRNLTSCKNGQAVETRDQFRDLFLPVLDKPLVQREISDMGDVFLFNLTVPEFVRLSVAI